MGSSGQQQLHRVELHLHLEGSLRPSTVFAVATRRGLSLPVATAEEFADFLRRQQPARLADFLSYFPTLLSFVAGDRGAVVQLAHDFVEDCARNDTCYVECRCCPHLMTGDGQLTPEDVLRAVLEGLQAGEARFGVKVRVILSALRDAPEFCPELLRLAQSYAPHGVVGVDLAGDDSVDDAAGASAPAAVQFFRDAERSGLHRTVHAGENSGPGLVREALDRMHAERIGHGYHCLDDPQLYQRLLHQRLHLEVCPLSSRLTQAVLADWPHHPVQRFAADRASFSISTDDPSFTGQWLAAEYRLCADKIGLPAWELVRANYCAAGAAFLPEEERELLVRQLDEYYRVRV